MNNISDKTRNEKILQIIQDLLYLNPGKYSAKNERELMKIECKAFNSLLKLITSKLLILTCLLLSSNCFAYGEHGIDGGTCVDLQYGTRIKSEGGRPGVIIDCRVQDNIINTESYATIKWDDGETSEKHWSRLRKIT